MKSVRIIIAGLILGAFFLAACATDGGAAGNVATSIANSAADAAQVTIINGGSRADAIDAALLAAEQQALWLAPELVTPQWRDSVRAALVLLPILLSKSPDQDPVFDAVYRETLEELE